MKRSTIIEWLREVANGDTIRGGAQEACFEAIRELEALENAPQTLESAAARLLDMARTARFRIIHHQRNGHLLPVNDTDFVLDSFSGCSMLDGRRGLAALAIGERTKIVQNKYSVLEIERTR